MDRAREWPKGSRSAVGPMECARPVGPISSVSGSDNSEERSPSCIGGADAARDFGYGVKRGERPEPNVAEVPFTGRVLNELSGPRVSKDTMRVGAEGRH